MKRVLTFFFAILLVAGAGSSSQTKRWISDTAADFSSGRGEGVAITADGRLVPVPRWQTLRTLEEPMALAAAMEPGGGVVVGTGHPARLVSVKGSSQRLVAEVPAEQVTALLRLPDGDFLVATVGPAVIFRLHDGSLDEVGRLGKGGVWDLALFGDTPIAAAGPPATLYRIGPRGLERWVELPDTHARSLAVDGDSLIVGTSGKGYVLRVDGKGVIAVVADTPFTEIASVVAAPGGVIWAAAVVGEPVEASGKGAKPGAAGGKEAGSTKEKVSAKGTSLKLPKVNGKTAASELIRVTPEGVMLSVRRFADQVVSALAWDGSGVLAGTGWEGEIWRFEPGGRGARLAAVDAVQVVAFAGKGRVALTQGPASVLVRDLSGPGGGTFRSRIKRFKLPVRFGTYRVQPLRTGVRIRFRSGLTADPDGSWLPWSDWLPAGTGTVPLPPASSLQWEVELPGTVTGGIDRVEVAHRQLNAPPQITRVTVAEPGAVWLASPPPTGQYIQVDHPDENGFFTVLAKGKKAASTTRQGKKYWRVGYRTVSWKAKDPNGDPLLFTLELEGEDGFVLPVRKDLNRTQLAIDVTALPDGQYRFVVHATDRVRNPGDPLETRVVGRWFTVDNTPPVINLRRSREDWIVEVRDGGSAVARAEYSRDGGEWKNLAPEDGMLDGQVERFRIPSAAGRHLLVIRAMDRHHNRATAGVTEE